MNIDDLDNFVNTAGLVLTKDTEGEFSTDAMNRIVELKDENLCGFTEAVVLFCEEQDIDPADFIKNCGKHIISIIRQNAIDERKVRKMSYAESYNLENIFS
jgi:hypothetical protein